MGKVSTPSRRMFICLRPPPQIVEELTKFLEPRWLTPSQLVWALPTQWHVTLAFLPQVASGKLDDLSERLEQAASRRRPLSVSLSGAGAFPDLAAARALYLQVTSEDDQLERLAVSVRNAANMAGCRPAGGKFVPHLTVARSRVPLYAGKWAEALATWPGATFPALEFELVESILGAGAHGRAVHQVRQRFAL